MGQVTTLLDLVERLASLDQEATIYTEEPWTPASKALVAIEPSCGGIPKEAQESGLTYFIEVSIALDHLDGWTSYLDHTPSVQQKCERLIQYAITDA